MQLTPYTRKNLLWLCQKENNQKQEGENEEQIGNSMLLRWVPVPNAVNQNFPTELVPTADTIKDAPS